ncbi:hypothetical protein KCU61_g5000, partial [Aureobasidium melanogenum]
MASTMISPATMSIPESTVLENWRYMHPDNTNVVILVSYNPEASYNYQYEAVIAASRNQGCKIFLKASCPGSHEAALRSLLYKTSIMMDGLLKGVPVQRLQVKSIGQATTNAKAISGKETTQGIDELEQSLEEVEMKRLHKALGHVIDLASRNLLLITSKQQVLISNSSMASLLALAIKILGFSLQSPQTISLEATTHVDLRAQIFENWRYLHPTATKDAIIVLTLKGRLWGQWYLAIITEGCARNGKIFVVSDPRENIELALHALLDATGDKINKMLYKRYESSLESKS